MLAELKHPLAPKPVQSWAASAPAWVEVRSPKSSLILAQLDPGESEAIALATEVHADVLLIDELVVEDLAPRDEGRLKAWTLYLHLSPQARTFDDLAAAEILTGLPLVRELVLPNQQVQRDFGVSIEMSHPALSAVRIEIEPPNAPSFVLADTGSLSGDSLRRTWGMADHPRLAEWRRRSVAGGWRLRIQHTGPAMTGKLGRSRIEVS